MPHTLLLCEQSQHVKGTGRVVVDRWALSWLPPPGSYYLQTRSSNWLTQTPSASRGMHSLVDPCWKSCRAAGSSGVVSPVHMHLLSLGVVDDMCKGKKPASEAGMQYACVPGGQATRRCAAWPEPRWGSLTDGNAMEARVGARQQGDSPAQNRFSGISNLAEEAVNSVRVLEQYPLLKGAMLQATADAVLARSKSAAADIRRNVVLTTQMVREYITEHVETKLAFDIPTSWHLFMLGASGEQ
ncbi:TPA: hypothetical protein ACH3X2_007276 [Trebouxia sp. C0005]